jgi:beta-lactamase regulating signal transducer with metallopeptidase domain
MTAAWMLYALCVGLFLSLAALAAERTLILLRRPLRGLWTAALALSLLIPALAPLLPRGPLLPAPLEQLATITRDVLAAPLDGLAPGQAAAAWPGTLLDRVLVFGWIGASLVLSQLVLVSMAVLRGRRREWPRRSVDGVTALVAPDFGPAVVGWRRLEIVLPAWTLALAPAERALVVRHEREHLERNDPRLLFSSFLLVILMPWNPFVWLQFRRLRRAIEIDCDARVIGSGVPPARYGEVLLHAAGLSRDARLPALSAFAERARDLEARIEALARRAPARRGLRMAVAGSTALLLGAAACVMPDPLSPAYERVLELARNPANAQEISAWVERFLAGRRPLGIVVVVRSSAGEILAIDEAPSGGQARNDPEKRSKLLNALPHNAIASIEVLKGGAIRVPGLEGLIVISLKPGANIELPNPSPLRRPDVGAKPDSEVALLKIRNRSALCLATPCILYPLPKG